MRIGNREIGPGHATYIIGEVGYAHDGSVNRAHEFIDVIADAGCSAVKFQCHMECDRDEEWRINPAYQRYEAETRYQYRQRVVFAEATWHALAAHCRDRQVDFLCSPFDMAAFETLKPLVPAWKVASGQVTNLGLIRAMAETGKPLILSTGMATVHEIQQAIRASGWVYPVAGADLAILQCSSMYPSPAGQIGLGSMRAQAARLLPNTPYQDHQFEYGLSDHSGTIYAGLAAVALGASIIEVHVKLSHHETGPDASSSLTPLQLGQLVDGAHFIREALKPVNKDVMASTLERTRALFLHKER